MTGSWHTYATHSPWRKPSWQAALWLGLPGITVVCFSPKTLELLTSTELRRHPWLSRLGPDILATDCDPGTLVARFRAHPDLSLGQAVMHQQIVCGIGNVYKSEILFLVGVNPWRSVGEVPDEVVERVLTLARSLMQKNLAGYPRRTRFGGDGSRQWVYGRAGEPCLRCGQRIRMRRQGDLGRSTYWCPECQT